MREVPNPVMATPLVSQSETAVDVLDCHLSTRTL